MTIPVQIIRVAFTTPCPVPVEPGTGRVVDEHGQPLPLEARTELCAVDAEWLIGSQRVCSHHLRELWDLVGLGPGTYEDLVRQSYDPDYVEVALARHLLPWGERHRYSQEEAQSWAESAKEHGLA
jgi:hypothetical protein